MFLLRMIHAAHRDALACVSRFFALRADNGSPSDNKAGDSIRKAGFLINTWILDRNWNGGKCSRTGVNRGGRDSTSKDAKQSRGRKII